MLLVGLAVAWQRIGGDALRPVLAGDSYSYFLPAYAYEADRLRAGGFPFWNPYQGGGVPFLATLQPGALYPARLLLLVLSPPRAMAWSAFLHGALALAGTYALCRRLRAPGAAAALGAIVYAMASTLPTITAPQRNEAGAWMPIAAMATVMVAQEAGGVRCCCSPWSPQCHSAGGYQMMSHGVARDRRAAALLDARSRGITGTGRAITARRGRHAHVATAAPQPHGTGAARWSAGRRALSTRRCCR
jgi:hypothetical protein